MNARSALFDLYGDHLLSRGGQAPVAALVRLLAPLRVTPPAVRTAVSRMARQGWLVPVRLPDGAGYRLTPRAVARLEQAADRIYRRHGPAWDGRWHVVIAERVAERARRQRLKSGLEYLGYASLDGSAWISPHPSVELAALLATEQVSAESFRASYDGDPARLAARAWNLDSLATSYQRWLAWAGELLAATGADQPDDVVFMARSELVHEWRKFLFIDPALPAELLPPRWPGAVAADLFHAEADRLLPAAARFVDCCLAGRAGPARSARQGQPGET
ncbi:MAG TPA: PaaX family transcriptional regulator C-terminal domain-containing protein [Streptosporangiaceae bacterium]|nr:PaaX family transcriptional regulator C-terminal domain-containing protein [Streptosporangiaceae bacterium]